MADESATAVKQPAIGGLTVREIVYGFSAGNFIAGVGAVLAFALGDALVGGLIGLTVGTVGLMWCWLTSEENNEP